MRPTLPWIFRRISSHKSGRSRQFTEGEIYLVTFALEKYCPVFELSTVFCIILVKECDYCLAL